MRKVDYDVMWLSSGTLATLSGYTSYNKLDELHAEFLAFTQKQPYVKTWQESWERFKKDKF